MENLICTKCNSTNYILKRGEIHLTAICADCDSYIKHLPVDKPKLYFGRYKGQEIEIITDLRYLQWVLKETKQTARIRAALNERISTLEYLYK